MPQVLKYIRFRKVNTSFLFLSLTILFFSSCTRDDVSIPDSSASINEDLGEVSFPANFNFSTYHDVTLDFSDAQMRVYRLYGIYNSQRDLIGTARAEGGRLLHTMQIPIHYTALEAERYTRDQMKMVRFELTGGVRTYAYDYNVYRKGQTTSPLIPTNVLYAVNSQKDFLTIDLNDFSTTRLSDLSEGTIACAVDTVADKVYYHNKPNMYVYDIATATHSISNVNPNPFNSNYPRMEYDHESGHLFISNGTSIHEVDPQSGNTVRSYTVQGIVNNSGGGDLAFPPNGKRYLACFSGLYELNFVAGSNAVQATRLSAENMPYQLTSLGYDRNNFLYACTNEANSKLLKMDSQDVSFQIVKTFPMTINDLGSVVSNGTSISTGDSDNDGICDELDDHPNDPEVAFDEFTPSQLGHGSMAFEDMWPGEGDYDFNDLVVAYRYVQMRNAANELVRLEARFVVKAVGASYNNGFGIQLDIDPSLIASVSGGNYQQGLVSLDAKGLEAAQTTPTIIVFESAFDVIDHVGGAYINTDPNMPISEGDTVNIVIKFVNPLASTSIIPSNPFIFVDGQRGHEVHMADGLPTQLVDASLFGQQEDNSNPSTARYYKDENNVPWAIDVAHEFRHPQEKVRVDQAYTHFIQWGMSAGLAYPDWYKDNSGYRNESELYMKE